MTEDTSLEIDKLIENLKDENYAVREVAAEALGEIGDARAVEPLINALGDGGEVGGCAVGALVRIGKPAVEPLINVLGDEDEEEGIDAAEMAKRYIARTYVREYAVGALGEIGDERAVEPLIGVLSSSDLRVRWSATEALDKLGWVPETDEQRAARNPLYNNLTPSLETLIEALVNDDEFISNEALEPLISIGETAVEPLIETAMDLLNGETVGQNTDEGWGLWQIANALGGIGDARAVEVLIKIMSDDYACDGAVGALVSIGKPAVEPLIKVLSDDEEWVRDAAKDALKKLGHEVE